MTKREVKTDTVAEATGDREPMATSLPARRAHDLPAPVGLARRQLHRPRSLEQAEEAYVAARDAWLAAMRSANGGRAADLASLALAQEAYEAAAEERDRWLNGEHVAIPVESARGGSGIDAIVRQEMAWRKVHETEQPSGGPLRRLLRRLGGR